MRGVFLAGSGILVLAGLLWAGNESNVYTWRVFIRILGEEKAYTRLLRVAQTAEGYERHDISHAFGEALYREHGIAAVDVCELEYTGGCLHEMFGRYAEERGEVVSFSDVCAEAQKNRRVCGHGLGHGLYLEYGSQGILAVVDACVDEFGAAAPRCWGGAFMEHNMRSSRGEGPRSFDGNRNEPCASLSDAARSTCFFWQPQWWHRTAFENTLPHDAFTEMGAWCASLERENDRTACFEGLGFIAPYGGEPTPSVSRMLCEAAANDPTLQRSCRVAAGIHLEDFQVSGERVDVCAGDSEKGECERRIINRITLIYP